MLQRSIIFNSTLFSGNSFLIFCNYSLLSCLTFLQNEMPNHVIFKRACKNNLVYWADCGGLIAYHLYTFCYPCGDYEWESLPASHLSARLSSHTIVLQRPRGHCPSHGHSCSHWLRAFSSQPAPGQVGQAGRTPSQSARESWWGWRVLWTCDWSIH